MLLRRTTSLLILLFLFLLLVLAIPTSAAGGTVTLITHDVAGTATGNSHSFPSGLGEASSGDLILLSSSATNLVSGIADTNSAEDVFLYNTVTDTITLVSHNLAGTGTGNGSSIALFIAADGSKVLFSSTATNLTADTNINGAMQDVYLYDVATGAITLVSGDPGGSTGNNLSFGLHISDDGSKVLFQSDATNLAPVSDTNGARDVFLYDVASNTITLVSKNLAGTATANGASQGAIVANDGSIVLFSSTATNLTADTNFNATMEDAYLYDVASGAITLISHNVGETGTANGVSRVFPGYLLPDDNSKVLFISTATDLTADANNNGLPASMTANDVYLYDIASGAITLVSHNSSETGTGNGGSSPQAISQDGSKILLSSQSTNLVSITDGNSNSDTFLYDVASGDIELITHNATNTATGNAASMPVALSENGNIVLFNSLANDLTATSDMNSALDTFRYNVEAGTAELISKNTSGTAAGNQSSNGAWLSDDGTRVVFYSLANDITSTSDTNSANDIFFYEAIPDSAPNITSANNISFVVGRSGSFTVTATGSPAPTFSVTTGTLPTGVTLNPTTGVLSGTPAAGTPFSNAFIITASNGVGTDATQFFTLLVLPEPTWTFTSLMRSGCAATVPYFKTNLTKLVIDYQYTGSIVVKTASDYYMAQTGPMKFTKTSGAMGVLLYANNSMGVSPMLPFPLPSGSPVQVILTIGTVEGTPLYRTTFNYVCNTGAVSNITSGPVP